MRILLVEDDRLLGEGIEMGLKQQAYTVDWLRDGDAYEDVDMVLTKEPVYEIKLAFQVWDNQGNMILRSGNAPLYPLTRQASGYSEQTIDGG